MSISLTDPRFGASFNLNGFLQKLKWEYEYNKNDFSFKFMRPINSDLKKINYNIGFTEDSLIETVTCRPLSAKKRPEDFKDKMAELICRINQNISSMGFFTFNYDTNELGFKIVINLSFVSASNDVLLKILLTPIEMFEEYSDTLIDVMCGIKSPKESVTDSERSIEDGLRDIFEGRMGRESLGTMINQLGSSMRDRYNSLDDERRKAHEEDEEDNEEDNDN